ncbi:MAG: hypothetical protein ACM3UW_09795 [Bacillota bacterium]
MRRDKALPFRIVFTVIVVTLDFIVLPQLLLALIHFKQGTFSQFQFSFFGWITALPHVKDVWIWIQPMAIGAVTWIWLTGRSLVNMNYLDDVPQPSGHGQHGTARWQTDEEIGHNFKVHRF